ncbi:MAG: hypothetical protein AAB967_02590 [Patescibacteria group bacterium]
MSNKKLKSAFDEARAAIERLASRLPAIFSVSGEGMSAEERVDLACEAIREAGSLEEWIDGRIDAAVEHTRERMKDFVSKSKKNLGIPAGCGD